MKGSKLATDWQQSKAAAQAVMGIAASVAVNPWRCLATWQQGCALLLVTMHHMVHPQQSAPENAKLLHPPAASPGQWHIATRRPYNRCSAEQSRTFVTRPCMIRKCGLFTLSCTDWNRSATRLRRISRRGKAHSLEIRLVIAGRSARQLLQARSVYLTTAAGKLVPTQHMQQHQSLVQ
jgi:hypothetical protein